MKKWTILGLLLLLAMLAVFPAQAEEAEDLTPGLTVKVVDKSGKLKSITDGKYTTYWESSKRRNPYVILSSEKPVYGLYLCFRTLPESYVIQKQSGEDDWVTVAEGDVRYHHAFYELEGLTKIRVLSTADKKNSLGFNEIYCFGPGEIPNWVQRWQPTVEKADLLFLIAHPDDELLFTGGAIPTYAVERGNRVVVAYFTPSNPTRRSEALNGLWAMGVRNYPVFGAFSDRYASTGKLKDAYKLVTGGKDKVWGWVTELFRRYRPEVVVTHDLDGEYGHPQHKMMADSAIACYTAAADAAEFPESAGAYGVWQVKKLYLHLYGEEADQTVMNWELPLASMGGKTGTELAIEAFDLHVSQHGMGTKIHGKFVAFTVEDTGGVRYPNTRFGLHSTEVGPDEAKDDFLEHVKAETETKTESEPEAEPKIETETESEPEAETESETETESKPEGEPEPKEKTETEAKTEPEPQPQSEPESDPADGAGNQTGTASAVSIPEWAEVTLNARGYLDEGEYVYADDAGGHYLFVNQTLRVVIERTYEVPDKKHPFYCFTAHIWCDTAAGELPTTVFKDPEKPKSKTDFMRNIARENQVVFATTTDYYIYRIKADYPTGIEVRNGEVIFDDPHKLVNSMPTYETLALYRDGHGESYPNPEKDAASYVADGAIQVYTFGPCLVKNGELTDYVLNKANSSYNPRLAIGVVEDGHYVVMLCEGRLKRSKGVQMAQLARMMQDQGCTLAVNMDGGQSAVLAFMGCQLNQVVKSDPNGREQADILAFGRSDQVGVFEMLDEFKSGKK